MDIRKSIANYVICNNLSINILDFDYGLEDKVIWRWSNSNKVHMSKIYTSRKGNYILIEKTRFYLNDFLRSEIL